MVSINTEWYVAFTGADQATHVLFSRVLKEGFKHCLCFSVLRGQGAMGDHIVFVDPTPYHVDISTMIDEVDPSIAVRAEHIVNAFHKLGYRVVRFQYTVDNSRTLLHFGNAYPSCVTVIKCVLGIRSWSVTPYQLFKWLIRNGAEQLGEGTMSGIFGGGDGGAAAARRVAQRERAESKRLREQRARETAQQQAARRRQRATRGGVLFGEETGVRSDTLG